MEEAMAYQVALNEALYVTGMTESELHRICQTLPYTLTDGLRYITTQFGLSFCQWPDPWRTMAYAASSQSN